jgi:hypothetical protein
MAHKKDDTTIRNYHVYLLPHGRGYRKPKVGMSSVSVKQRKSENKSAGLNVEGYRVLEWITGTVAEAEAIETRYQIHYDCVDGPKLPNSAAARKKISLALTGKIQPAEINAKRSATMMGKNTGPKPKLTCPYCSREIGGASNMPKHITSCKFNPINL